MGSKPEISVNANGHADRIVVGLFLVLAAAVILAIFVGLPIWVLTEEGIQPDVAAAFVAVGWIVVYGVGYSADMYLGESQ